MDDSESGQHLKMKESKSPFDMLIKMKKRLQPKVEHIKVYQQIPIVKILEGKNKHPAKLHY